MWKIENDWIVPECVIYGQQFVLVGNIGHLELQLTSRRCIAESMRELRFPK